ncbi:MAG: Citrate transporter [Anaerosporomusa subterranea]|jgi:Na+/H+ antiporter NhaD/arsenite permease-like protein|nr:Citrate transporter [Anaerosporomusa subterranea]
MIGLDQYTVALVAGVILALALFIFTLGKSPVFRVDRAGSAIIGAAAMIACGVLSFEEAMQSVDFKTIVILFSMMIVVANLKIAGFFDLIGSAILRQISSKQSLLLSTIMVSGVMSALAINDVVCLLFTPVVLLVCRRGKCNPMPHLLAVAMASNIGSAATLLGNPQNILIGSLSGLSFASYFFTASPIALGGLLLTHGILSVFYRRELSGFISPEAEQHSVVIHGYLIAKTLLVLTAILAAYIAGFELALASSVGAAFLLITRRVNPNKVYASVDFNLLVIFIGLFIIVGGVEKSGLMGELMAFLPSSATEHRGRFAVLTVILSNIVSNVPAVLLLKFFVPADHAEVWWKSLALFSTLAGNLTITGSVANLIVAEIAKRNNVAISAKEYLKAGLPLTVLTTGMALVWLTLFG